MKETLESLFRSDYMPHGHCYWWKPEILWLNVVSDTLIALAYFSIPIALYYFIKKRQDLEFRGIFILFSLFILFCGITHIISIFVIWQGAYGLHGLAKLATAIVSCITAYKLFKAIPTALTIPSPKALKILYERANKEEMERVKLESQKHQDFMLRESTDNAHMGILVLAVDGTILVANRTACNIFEDTKENIEGKNINIFLLETDKSDSAQEIKAFFNLESAAKHKVVEHVVKGSVKTCSEVPIEMNLNRRSYANENLIFASFEDISSRLMQQQALSESETFTRNIIDSLPIGMHVFTLKDDELYLTNYNRAAVNILGIVHTPLLGKKIEEAFPDTVNTPVIEAYKTIATEGGTWKNETVEYSDNKIAGMFDVTCFQSSVNTAVVLFEDISEKYQAQQALHEKERFIEAAFDASITGCYIYNLEKQTTEYINTTYTRITGYSLADLNVLTDQEFLELVHKDDRKAVLEHVNKLTDLSTQEKVLKVEYRFKHKNGEWTWCLSQDIVLERNDNGKAIRFMGSFLDISGLKAR